MAEKESAFGEDFDKDYKEFVELNEKYSKHYQARGEIVKDDMTGFVWILYQK